MRPTSLRGTGSRPVPCCNALVLSWSPLSQIAGQSLFRSKAGEASAHRAPSTTISPASGALAVPLVPQAPALPEALFGEDPADSPTGPVSA